MNYRESEREKVVRIRDHFFNDPGGGIYKNEPRPFVLINPEKNLWKEICKETIKYFDVNRVVWWPGSEKPSGHLLSSQISCLNHLFYFRNDKGAALKLLQNINSDFTDVCADFENRYIGFEVVSKNSYLGEVTAGAKQTRGANCTSVDAMMTGILKSGKKIQVLIEWKYTEYYPEEDKSSGTSGKTRKSRYDALIDDKNSPIKRTVSINNFYFEPFYQTMRQTLLAWKMIENKSSELNADDWLHIDIIPENNLSLRYFVPSPNFIKIGTEEAWKSQLNEPEKYRIVTPQKLLQPFIFDRKYRGLINYLNYRYW